MLVLSGDQRATGQDSLSVAFKGSVVAGIQEPHCVSQATFQMSLTSAAKVCSYTRVGKGFKNTGCPEL